MYQHKIYFTIVNPVNNFLTFENVMYWRVCNFLIEVEISSFSLNLTNTYSLINKSSSLAKEIHTPKDCLIVVKSGGANLIWAFIVQGQ